MHRGTLLTAALLLSAALTGCVGGEGLGFTSAGGGAPTAAIEASALSVQAGEEVTFRAKDANAAFSYQWDMGGFDTLAGAEVTYAFPYDNHTYPVTLRVTGAGDLNATATVDVVVGSGENAPPHAALWSGGEWVKTGDPVRFDATNTTDADGDPLSLTWTIAKAVGGGGGGDGHDHQHGHGIDSPAALTFLGPGHGDGGHGDAQQFGLEQPANATGDAATLTFDEAGTYRVTVTAEDPKGATSRAHHVLEVSEFVPKRVYNVTHTGTLKAGTLGSGASTTAYQAFYPPENTYVDGALYEFVLRYPAETTITLTWADDPAASGRVQDLDFQLLHLDTGDVVAEGAARSATTGETVEQDSASLPGGSYRLTVQAHTGAEIAYALNVFALLDVDPDTKPYSGASNE